MKAIIFDRSRGATLKEVPVPQIGDGEVLVQVHACGLCGSDLLKLDHPPAAGTVILGHEISGALAAIGRGVEGFAVGDRVAAAHHVPCGTCHYCERGSVSMCQEFKSTNVDPGGFAEFVRLSAAHVRDALIKLPPQVDPISACLMEPLACCLRNLRRMGVRAGDSVGVVGLGSIGLMTCQALVHRGAVPVGLETDQRRLRKARDLGIAAAAPADFSEAAKTASLGRGLDSVIVTAGPAENAARALGWLRDGGTLSLFSGYPKDAPAPIDLDRVYHRELTILSTYSSSPQDLKSAVELLAAGAIKAAALAAPPFELERFDEAVRSVRKREILKAVLAPKPR